MPNVLGTESIAALKDPLLMVAALILLRVNLWRAVLFVWPASIRLEADSPPGMAPMPSSLAELHQALVVQGFEPLGTHLEHPRLRAEAIHFDYLLAEQRVFATLVEGPRGAPRLTLFTPTEGGGALTAGHRVPARDIPGRYASGGIEAASPERLLKAHLRRAQTVGAPSAEWTLEGRVSAGRRWYAGIGQVEVRQQNAVGLLWTLGALGMVGAALFGWSR